MLRANGALFEAAVLPEVLGRLKVLEDRAKRGVFVPFHLDKGLFKESNDGFPVKAVRNADEIAPLLETGFEYHCEKDGMMFFRKRK